MLRVFAIPFIILFLTVSTLGQNTVICITTFTCYPAAGEYSCRPRATCGSGCSSSKASEPVSVTVVIVGNTFDVLKRGNKCIAVNKNCKCDFSLYRLGETLDAKRFPSVDSPSICRPVFNIDSSINRCEFSHADSPSQLALKLVSISVLRC